MKSKKVVTLLTGVLLAFSLFLVPIASTNNSSLLTFTNGTVTPLGGPDWWE